MGYMSWEISAIAFLPALILCVFIYCKDRVEKEPIGLLTGLFFAGAVSYFPAFAVERFITGGIDKIFERYISFSADGAVIYESTAADILHKVLCAFVGVALVEVGIKWCILFFGTRNNKNFNYLFDGIVYSAFISLGFAAVENVRYAWVNGWDTLALRSLSSVPCHLFVGVLMGYYYTVRQAYKNAQKYEKALIDKGFIDEAKINIPQSKLIISLLLPFILAGTYMFAGTIVSDAVNTVFYFVLFMFYGICFIGVDRISSEDSARTRYSVKIVAKAHPELTPQIFEGVYSIADGAMPKEDAENEE